MTKKVKLFISMALLVSVCWLPVGYGFAAKLPNFVGIDYGPFHKDGQGPSSPIPNSQFLADLAIMAGKFTYIKTYGCDTASRLNQFVPLVHANYSKKLKIFLGVFETAADRTTVTQPQLNLAIQQANLYPDVVQCVVVGNECLDRDSNPHPVSVQQLIADLQQVRSGIANKNILVTTCLGYASAQTYGSQLMPYCDVMMVNIYPFYAGPNGIGIDQAWSNLKTNYTNFVNQFSGKQVIVGETGWPSSGPPNGSASPSIANEQTCITQILANAPNTGPIFVFEAFDEPWKTENGWAPNWGVWDKNGALKIKFGTYLTADAVSLADQNGNGSEEVAFLRQDLDQGQIKVLLKDGQTGNQIGTMPFFGTGWTAVALAPVQDLNGNGTPEIAVLAFNQASGAVKVVIKDAATEDLVSKIDFDKNYQPKELIVRSDNHIAVLGTNPVNNITQVEVRNALNGTLIKKTRVFNEL